VFDKVQAVLAVQLVGIPTLLGIAALTRLHWLELHRAGDVHHGEGFGVLAFLGALTYYPLAYWTLTGMETGLLSLLLLVGSFLAMVYMRVGRSRVLAGAAAVFSLAFLARPDSAPVAALVLLAAALSRDGASGMRARDAALAIAVYAAGPLLQTLFRVGYYGSLVPLTYTLKATGMPWPIRLQNGIGFALPYLKETLWIHLLAVTGALLGPTRRKTFLLVPPLAITAYQLAIGGDAWPYWRLLAPSLPYLVLLALAGVDRITSALESALPRILATLRSRIEPIAGFHGERPRRSVLLPVIVFLAGALLVLAGVFADALRPGSPGFGHTQLLLVAVGSVIALAAFRPRAALGAPSLGLYVLALLVLGANRRFLPEALFLDLPYKADANRNHVNAALMIDRYTTADASVGVFHAGIIPYFTSRYGIDFLGKNDPYIAHLPINLEGGPAWYGMSSVPGHNKYDLGYSIRYRRPTYVEGFVWGSQDLTEVFESEYVEISLPGPDPAFRRGDPAVRWEDIPADKILYP
jgi:hypothetical protein